MVIVWPTGASASSRMVSVFGGGMINWLPWSLRVRGGAGQELCRRQWGRVKGSILGYHKAGNQGGLLMSLIDRVLWRSLHLLGYRRLHCVPVKIHRVCVCVCVCARARAQSCPSLSDPMDCNPPCSSVHEISQARILEHVENICIPIADPRGCLPHILYCIKHNTIKQLSLN